MPRHTHPYVWTHEGWLYLAAILDLCSRRVVGWPTSANNDTPLALKIVTNAQTTAGEAQFDWDRSSIEGPRGCTKHSYAARVSIARPGSKSTWLAFEVQGILPRPTTAVEMKLVVAKNG
jgi:transposase InsO family protein